VEVEIVATATGGSKPKASAPFPGSLKFSSITHSHAVIPPYPALDLDNDFTIELWLRLAPGTARNGRAKCAWSLVLTDEEVEERQRQRGVRQAQEEAGAASASGAESDSLSASLSQFGQQQQQQQQQQQLGASDAVERELLRHDRPPRLGAQDGGEPEEGGDGYGDGGGANMEGGWSAWSPRTTGNVPAREEAEAGATSITTSLLSRAVAARRAALSSLETPITVPVDEAALAHLQQMGFSATTARRSLAVARNDMRQAVEFCVHGIPNERLFIARGAEALRLAARRAAAAESMMGAAAVASPSSPSSSTVTSLSASSSTTSSPSRTGGNRLSQLHAYLALLSGARG
jgi:hypothetical protein